ncbi:MAG: hypothetical protein V1685_06925 [Parcubacteria group bacterium]
MLEHGRHYEGVGMTDREIHRMQDEAARIAKEKSEKREALMRANQDEQERRRVQREFGQPHDMTKGDLRTAARSKK